MIPSSPGSTAAAPVLTGRAPRRVSHPIRRYRRALLVGVLTMLAGLTLVPAAWAHEGADPDIFAVLDRTSPEMPGVALTVQTTRLGSQFVLENPTPTEVTVLSSVGDPLFKIGPGGVLGNFRSPEWYTSKIPGGAVTIPERAAEKGTPVWVRVSKEPAWGWFDHRLHAATLTPEQKADLAPMQAIGGNWTVPIMYGDQLGSADGHLEFRPPVGVFTPTLSDTRPAKGVTLTALQGNPTPGIAINNEGPSEVVILGDEDEPYLRITPAGAEANQLSPTWIHSQDPSAVAGRGIDATAPPQWVPVGTNGQYAFTIQRADPDQDLAELYAVTSPTVVRDWTLALIVDGRRIDVPGQTTMTPSGYSAGGWGWWTVAGLVAVALVVAAAVLWFLRRRRGKPGGPAPKQEREPVGATS